MPWYRGAILILYDQVLGKYSSHKYQGAVSSCDLGSSMPESVAKPRHVHCSGLHTHRSWAHLRLPLSQINISFLCRRSCQCQKM